MISHDANDTGDKTFEAWFCVAVRICELEASFVIASFSLTS